MSYEQNDKVRAAYGFILISYLLIDKIYKKMPPKRRLSKPKVLRIFLLNGFSAASPPHRKAVVQFIIREAGAALAQHGL